MRRHMFAMRDVQQLKGRFADVAPVGGGFGGVLWGSAGIVVPWESYQQYGDMALLRSITLQWLNIWITLKPQ